MRVGFSNPGIASTYYMPSAEIQAHPKYCRPCRTLKINQTRHCLYCDVCILELDHHCPWVGKCIGKNNMGVFKFFLFATVFNLFVFAFFIY